jgi:hypothetical protein
VTLSAKIAVEPEMVWRGSAVDPANDIAAGAVLDAFEGARNAGLPAVDCYRAGVDAWRRTHPDQSAEYAAKQAVAVILAAKISLRIEE